MSKKLNRYQMDWSQADGAWLVVYAESFEEAQAKYENGEYTIETETP